MGEVDHDRHDDSQGAGQSSGVSAAGDAEAASTPFSLVAAGLVGGLIVGLLAALVLGGSDERPAPPPETVAPVPDSAEETVESAEAFLEAWERSRRATYLVVTEWHRVTGAGGEMRQTRVLVQRPPDRIRRAGGSVSGVAGGVRYTCDELADDEVTCQAVEDPFADVAFEERVAREVELMWRHLEGPNPLYRVSELDGCFHLRLVRTMLAPPYGARTTFCFDVESGAVARFRIERAEGIDTEEMVWVRTEVTPDDVVAVAEGRLDLRAPGR
jgi:hypothetical protein